MTRPTRDRCGGGKALAVATVLVTATLCSARANANMTVEVPADAQEASPITDGKPRITARLIADVSTVTAGDSFHIGVLFDAEPGWHIYWRNPGDAGFATEIDWRSGDATVGALQWPAPDIFREADGVTTYGYQNQVLLFATATVSDSVGQSLEMRADVRYLACNVICSPGQVSLRRNLAVGHQALPADDATMEVFNAFGKRVPSSADAKSVQVRAVYSQTKIRPGDAFRMALVVRGCAPAQSGKASCPLLTATDTAFAPEVMPALNLHTMAVKQLPGESEGLAIVLSGHLSEDADVDAGLDAAVDAAVNNGADAEAKASNGVVPTGHLRGVLQLVRGHAALRPFTVDVPIPLAEEGASVQPTAEPILTDMANAMMAPATTVPPVAVTGNVRLWQALLLALLGGLVLNLMPCVLPVLAIKVIGVTQVGRYERRDVMLHGLAYVFGVVTSMLLLAVGVVVLKALGTQVGWGFQFQEPAFVAFVSCVLVLFALNCFGVFEINASAGGLGHAMAKSHGLRRSVFDGVLAVVLATPCSAPFLGSAVAYALTQGPAITLCVFAAIGVGLASPYVVLTLTPGWLRFLPKPGPWMAHLKSLLGFGLLATVVWLVWLIGRFAGVDAVARLLLFLLGVAGVGWAYGIVGARFPTHPIAVGAALALLLAGIGFFSMTFRAEPPSTTGTPSALLHYRPYSHGAVLAELAAGHPAFVDFGADWCITCKFNEQHVLEDEGVIAAFKHYEVTMFRADWTRRDDTIRRTLASFGRSGVPMYLLYSPDKPTGPQVLPEILTAGQIHDALQSMGMPRGGIGH